MTYDEMSAWGRKIEDTYFRFFRTRGETAPPSERESNLRWRVLEDLLATGDPDFYATVEIDDTPTILIVIDDAAHLITTSEQEAVAHSVGSLGGGTYEEHLGIGENDEYVIDARYRHPSLPGEIVVRTDSHDAAQRTKPTRDELRRWASLARLARVPDAPWIGT